MRESEKHLRARDGAPLFVRCFLPEGTPRGIVQIVHGVAEHSARYRRLAEALTQVGYAVYADDHRGHGYTAATERDLGYFGDHNGWDALVSDLVTVLEDAKSHHPGVPVFLFGHSLGSYLARSVAIRHGDKLAGLVLSGPGHDHPLQFVLARHVIVALERLRLGKHGKSKLINQLIFGGFNKHFRPNRTPFDWLSRDGVEVDKYRADKFCGFVCTTQLWWDVFGGIIEVCTPANIARMPRNLPVYIMTGERDPLNSHLSGIRKLQAAFANARIGSVTCRIYPDARHEILNETNRDEVTQDLVTWLKAHTRAPQPHRASATSQEN